MTTILNTINNNNNNNNSNNVQITKPNYKDEFGVGILKLILTNPEEANLWLNLMVEQFVRHILKTDMALFKNALIGDKPSLNALDIIVFKWINNRVFTDEERQERINTTQILITVHNHWDYIKTYHQQIHKIWLITDFAMLTALYAITERAMIIHDAYFGNDAVYHKGIWWITEYKQSALLEDMHTIKNGYIRTVLVHLINRVPPPKPNTPRGNDPCGETVQPFLLNLVTFIHNSKQCDAFINILTQYVTVTVCPYWIISELETRILPLIRGYSKRDYKKVTYIFKKYLS